MVAGRWARLSIGPCDVSREYLRGPAYRVVLLVKESEGGVNNTAASVYKADVITDDSMPCCGVYGVGYQAAIQKHRSRVDETKMKCPFERVQHTVNGSIDPDAEKAECREHSLLSMHPNTVMA